MQDERWVVGVYSVRRSLETGAVPRDERRWRVASSPDIGEAIVWVDRFGDNGWSRIKHEDLVDWISAVKKRGCIGNHMRKEKRRYVESTGDDKLKMKIRHIATSG